ncbi:MAG: SLC13 family permease [Chloroflexota bacterium]
MTPEMIITLIVMVAATVLFVTEWIRIDLVALLVLIALVVTGVLTIEEAVAGFSSTAVLSIGFLFVVGGAIFQTGLAAMASDRILRIAGTSETRLIIVLMIFVGTIGAFISSTGVVALMMPAVLNLASRSKIPVSRLLMPLAFAALLSGTMSLIATPPNIIASEALENAGYAPFDFFSFTPLGILLLVSGTAVMVLLGRRLLPERRSTQVIQRMETPAELFALYRLPENLLRLRVRKTSPLVGKTVADSRLRSDFNVNIVHIKRNNARSELFPGPWGNGRTTTLEPTPDTRLEQNDVLLVEGDLTDVTQAAAHWNLGVMSNLPPIKEGDVITHELGIAEVLLRPRSSLIGKTLTELRFGSRYNLTVLSIRRPGVEEALDLKTTPLKLGDILLVQGKWKDIFALKQLRHDFVVMGEPEALEMGAFTKPTHAPIALLIMVGMVVAIAFNIMSLTLASIVAAVAVVLTGCIDIEDAYESVNWSSLILIAGMMPLGTALVKVGLVETMANGIGQLLGAYGPMAVIAGLFLLTTVMTQIASNTAAALLIAPIALATAENLGISPHAVLMAVAVAASMAFLTPVASPVNALVMSAGNYRFLDFARAGAPMLLVAFIITMILLPILWPL